MKQQLMARWNRFSIKEKRFLIALACMLLSLFFFAYAWLPVQHGRERLAQIIPEKQAKLLLMRSQSADVERLRGQYKSLTATAGALKAAIEVSAKYHGLAPSYTDVVKNNSSELKSEKQLALTLTQLSFETWIKWVESLQSQNHIRLLSCRISPEGATGQVRIDAVFMAAE